MPACTGSGAVWMQHPERSLIDHGGITGVDDNGPPLRNDNEIFVRA